MVGGGSRGRFGSVSGIGETGFEVGEASEIEGHY